MRMVILVGQFPPGVIGGAEAQAEQWATRLARHHAVSVITRQPAPGRPADERRAGFQVLRTPVSAVPGWRTVADLRAIRSAVRSLPRQQELLLCFQTFVSGLAGVRLQTRLGIPAVVWVRGEWEYRLRESLRARLFSARVWELARGVLVQSESIRGALLEQLDRLDGRAADRLAPKLKVVPNGITLPALPVAGGRKVLVLGRLIADKGVDVVIDALAGMPGAELLVAGDGPERGRLEALATTRRLPATFLGRVERERLPKVFAESRCLVLASRAGEGLPNALLEAMAWGIPVVATPVGGTVDLVQDGANGLLVPVGDPAALRAALSALLGDEILRARLSTAARATAADYGWDRVQPRLESALAAWVEAPHPGGFGATGVRGDRPIIERS